jgi:hypothetical protein
MPSFVRRSQCGLDFRGFRAGSRGRCSNWPAFQCDWTVQKGPLSGHERATPLARSHPLRHLLAPYTTNSGFQDSTKFVFTANPDGTLSSTSTIQNDPCTLSWTVSGSTATAMSNQTCGGFTVTSYTFKLEDWIAFAEATAVEHGTTTGTDGGPAPVDIAGGFAGFCTRGDAGTPTVCEQDSLVGCGANGVGYLCVGTTSPESLNSALSCRSSSLTAARAAPSAPRPARATRIRLSPAPRAARATGAAVARVRDADGLSGREHLLLP